MLQQYIPYGVVLYCKAVKEFFQAGFGDEENPPINRCSHVKTYVKTILTVALAMQSKKESPFKMLAL